MEKKNKSNEDGIFRIQWGNGYFYLQSKVVLWCRWLHTACKSEVISIWLSSPLYLFNGSSWFASRLGCAKANTKISFHFLSKQQLAVHLGVVSSPGELGEEKNHQRAHIFQGKRGGISGWRGGGGCGACSRLPGKVIVIWGASLSLISLIHSITESFYISLRKSTWFWCLISLTIVASE